ncbi:MAG TPA: DUF885 domain-containing protein [Planctomycetota bacterium]|nr:DUF885 domain-containing protein [Planctomycetota bacterium]
MDQTKRLEKLEKDFFKEWLHRNPLLGTSLGFHDDYDDKMPDGSLERQLDDIKFLQRTLAEFEKLDPKKLQPLQGVSRDFAIHLLKNWIFDRDVLRYWETQPEAPTVLGQSIFQILSRNYAPLGQRMRAIMKRLEKMPKYIDQSRSRLRTPVKQFVEIELETITRLPGFFNLLKDIGREHLPATPQRDLNRLIDQTQNALERYSDWLIVDVLPDCREPYAIGEDRYKKLLHVRGMDVSPGHIASLAESEIDKIKERQKEVAKAIKRKTPLEDIRDMIKQQHSENFDGVLRYVREAVQKTRQFVNRSKYAQFPEGEQLYVIETPSFLRHFQPFGGTWAPARFEAKQDGYLFVTPGDCDSDKLKEHNYGSLSSLAVREGYPGRYLQTSWAARHASMPRLIYEDTASAGGWAMYCEERAKDMGHDDTPPSRFMQLQSSILAAVRVMIDAKISVGKMTYQQSIETLIDYLGMDRVCAEAETRRYVVQPGVPTLHWWGREKMKDLRKWAKDRMETRFTETFFHMSILHAGVLPPPLLKREVDVRITEELRRPPDRPKDDHHHKKDDKKHAAVAAKAGPAKAQAKSKAAPKKPAPGPKPVPRKAKPAPAGKKSR